MIDGGIGMPNINYGPTINYKHCNGCGECYENCPMDVFGWDEKKRKPTVTHPAECRVCCVCEISCPEVAINVLIPLHVKIDFGIYPEKRQTRV
jgi:adenylylsulfate reductase subunit B